MQRRRAEYERIRELHHQSLVSKNELIQAENALAEAKRKVEDDKRWLEETDVAIREYQLLNAEKSGR